TSSDMFIAYGNCEVFFALPHRMGVNYLDLGGSLVHQSLNHKFLWVFLPHFCQFTITISHTWAPRCVFILLRSDKNILKYHYRKLKFGELVLLELEIMYFTSGIFM